MNYKNIKKSDTINFDKLDKNGIVKEGSYVDANDAIIGKCGEETNINGDIINVVSGKKIKFSTSGIVDKVIVTKNKDTIDLQIHMIFKDGGEPSPPSYLATLPLY